MSKPIPIPRPSGKPSTGNPPAGETERLAFGHLYRSTASLLSESAPSRADAYLADLRTPSSMSSSPPSPPGVLSRSDSLSGEDADAFPPLDRLTVFDVLENLALPQRLERLQHSLTAQKEKVRRHQQKLRTTSASAKDRVVDEWRRRVPTSDEKLEKYKRRMRDSVERLGRRWNDQRSVTTREKVAFIAGVLNIFISGYLIGAWPECFHLWYTAQLFYFMPIRAYTYHKRGYHYFLADLCYFVNALMMLGVWVFPGSKRLFISTYCLAFGNNAIAIAMWRNMLVFHSLDKITSLFIHIMPCVTLHCLVHLVDTEYQKQRYPAIYTIKHSPPSAPEHYSLPQMMFWASVPYAIWQLSYHFMISVRRRDKIRAGRPTSFTWLKRSYSPTWIGKFVLSLPAALQEPAFMCIQYGYALLTMLPCPLWFYSRWASATFLSVVFCWSIYNGATYYIEIFGRRFQAELESLKRDVTRWQSSPDALRAQSMYGLTPTPTSGPASLTDPLSAPSPPAVAVDSPAAGTRVPAAAAVPGALTELSLGMPGMSLASAMGEAPQTGNGAVPLPSSGISNLQGNGYPTSDLRERK